MNRTYLLFISAIAVAILLGLAIAADAGYVLISYRSFRYQSGIWVFLALIVLLALAIYGVRQLWRLLDVSGGLINPWSRRHRQRRVRFAAQRGLLDLAEGQWQRALRHLRRAAARDPQPLVHYLGAARAANELGEYAESDQLLRLAHERDPHAEIAIGLTQAQLQIARGQYAEALASLLRLRQRRPGHRHVLKLLQQLYVQMQDWPALCQLLPDLRRSKVLTAAELDDLERLTWLAALQQAGQRGLELGESALQPLTQQWQQLPSRLRGDPELVRGYAEQLRQLGAQEEAEKVLRTAIAKHFEDSLVYLYGLVRGADPTLQLQTAEGWLKGRPDSAVLLLTIGRLCLLNQLWGKARDYFEASLARQRNAEICGELARLLARLGETERSNQLFQEGLGLLNRGLPALPQPGGG
jgi:HemY protein